MFPRRMPVVLFAGYQWLFIMCCTWRQPALLGLRSVAAFPCECKRFSSCFITFVRLKSIFLIHKVCELNVCVVHDEWLYCIWQDRPDIKWTLVVHTSKEKDALWIQDRIQTLCKSDTNHKKKPVWTRVCGARWSQ